MSSLKITENNCVKLTTMSVRDRTRSFRVNDTSIDNKAQTIILISLCVLLPTTRYQKSAFQNKQQNESKRKQIIVIWKAI